MRQRLLSLAGATGVIVALIGIVLAIGGAELLRYGGTVYYLVTGVALSPRAR